MKPTLEQQLKEAKVRREHFFENVNCGCDECKYCRLLEKQNRELKRKVKELRETECHIEQSEIVIDYINKRKKPFTFR